MSRRTVSSPSASSNPTPFSIRTSDGPSRQRRRVGDTSSPLSIGRKTGSRASYLLLAGVAGIVVLWFHLRSIPNDDWNDTLAAIATETSLLIQQQQQLAATSYGVVQNEGADDIRFFEPPTTPCGAPWSTYKNLLKAKAKERADSGVFDEITDIEPLLWTVSGGNEYRSYANAFLWKWKTFGMDPALVVALDVDTAKQVCDAGFQSVLWDKPRESYSLVADAKFGVATYLASNKLEGLFLELDIFCRSSPLPVLREYITRVKKKGGSMVLMGHGDVNFNPNIGMYYVRPQSLTASFFSSLITILSYSKDEKYFVTQNKIKKEVFDQAIFHQCLPPTNKEDIHRKIQRKAFLVSDTEFKNDLMLKCKNATSPQFEFEMLPHSFIQSLDPPSVYDNTVCIHPLSVVPFSSLSFKLGAAKILGFDPFDVRPEEKLIKTLTGDLGNAECWSEVFTYLDWDGLKWQKERLKRQIATLVYIAEMTNRTLVMPRHFRDKDSWAAPIASIVDLRTIEMQTKYRYLSPTDNSLLQKQTVVESFGSIVETVNAIQQQQDQKVVALDPFCKLLSDDSPPARVAEIQGKLKFCMGQFIETKMRFGKGVGGWSRMCGAFEAAMKIVADNNGK